MFLNFKHMYFQAILEKKQKDFDKIAGDNELKIALDHAIKANAEAEKNINLYQDQIKDLQSQVSL